jgi:hypothetical protein
METSIDGVRFIRWLSTSPPEDHISLLKGCIIEDEVDDFDQVVTDYDSEEKIFECTVEGRLQKIPLAKVSKGNFCIPSDRLLLIRAIEDAQPQSVKDGDETLRFLRGKNVNIGQINDIDDAHIVRKAFEKSDAGEIPNYDDQTLYYEVFKKCQLFREAAKIFSSWLEQSEGKAGPFNPQLRIKVAFFYRHSGLFKEAIELTNVVFHSSEDFPGRPKEIAILSTIRAAALLDLFERGPGDDDLLAQARSAAGRAWSIASKTGELAQISGVYGRLKKHEDELTAE